ncbi:extensin family protein [Pelagibacterium montanilacus]|uniref:extensin-like domain-containing protein n=1 Tax=Pelagibacterium montanilacus TaxID=2185280 RepID=UPI000F8C948D|nr:extensin family protein [Pelagibacterium montanilacus]
MSQAQSQPKRPLKRLALFGLLVVLAMAGGQAIGQDEEAMPPLPEPRPADLAAPAAEDSESQEPGNQDAGSEEAEAESAPEDGDRIEGERERVYQVACPALISGQIEGEVLEPIAEGTCGISTPIRIGAVMIAGRRVELTGSPVISCAVGETLAQWAGEVDAFAHARTGARISALRTGPGYQCRLRNRASTGFVSEHGLGNAVDITALEMDDGSAISVLDDWERGSDADPARVLGFAHDAACGRFTTVLGPEANALHADHFHFDLGCHGQSCRAQICE